MSREADSLKADDKKASQGLASIAEAYETLLSERPGILASESGGELSWLRKARERDANRWQAEGLPTRQSERWKYTSLQAIETAHWVTPAHDGLQTAAADLKGSFSGEIVIFNGRLVPQMSRLPKIDGLRVTDLSQILQECIEKGWTPERRERFAAFREHIETSDADRETVFAAMNTSFMQDAVLIHADRDVVLKEPLLIRHLSASGSLTGGAKAFICPRVFIHVASGAELAVIEYFTGAKDGGYLVNTVSDLRVEEGARLSHCRIQSDTAEGLHFGATRLHQMRGSFTESFQFSFGAALARQDLHVSLEGEGAEAHFDGLYLASGKQHVDNYTLVEHLVPNTVSDQMYKGILDGEARAVFNGHVRIHRDAQKSNAAQVNRNLVLSRKAEVDTRPELEIEADDVKASHGATIGQIDPEHVLYLQTRAIPKVRAIQMLSRGFAQEVVFRIKNEQMRKTMYGMVDRRFADMEKSHV